MDAGELAWEGRAAARPWTCGSMSFRRLGASPWLAYRSRLTLPQTLGEVPGYLCMLWMTE